MRFGSLIIFCVPVMICSCAAKKNKQAEERERQLNNNGVVVKAKFMNGNSGVHDAMSDSNYLYFDIQIEKPGFEPDKKTIQYLDFGVQNDFKMLSNGDSIPPALVHRVINGRKELFEYIIVFRKELIRSHPGEKLEIIYGDKIFGTGNQVFEFLTTDLFRK